MKELSIEEKAKRYDEALKYAMIYYKDGNEDMKMMMKTCFPVLVEESEDERIRKEIVSYLKTRKGYTEAIKDPWIAWLEKQGDKNKFIEKELGCIKGYREKAIKRLEELEKQGEQKPTDKVEPKFKVGDWVTIKQ